MLVPRPGPRREPGWRRAALATVLALIGHGLLLLLLLFLSHLKIDAPALPRWSGAMPSKPVVLRGLSAEQWARNRGEAAPRVKDERQALSRHDEPQPKPEKPKPEPMPKGQIVDVAPGNDQVDPNAKYIAATNNAVKKQTRAKEQTAYYRNAMPRRTSPHPLTEAPGHDDVDQAQRNGNSGLGDDDRPLREGQQKLALEIPDVKAREEVALKMPATGGPGVPLSNTTETEAVKGNSNRLKLVPGGAEGEDGSQGRAGTKGVLTLLPSPAVMDKLSGAAAPDHLADVDEGDGTYLSTREWKYAGFFNRVKQSVGQQWHPQEQLRLRDPTFQIYGGRDRYTLLQVTLKRDGRLQDVYVEKSSGLDFLDLEAIKAFERAQPFPNPPPGILAADMTVRFQFGFFLEMSGRPGLQLFRSAD